MKNIYCLKDIRYTQCKKINLPHLFNQDNTLEVELMCSVPDPSISTQLLCLQSKEAPKKNEDSEWSLIKEKAQLKTNIYSCNPEKGEIAYVTSILQEGTIANK